MIKSLGSVMIELDNQIAIDSEQISLNKTKLIDSYSNSISNKHLFLITIYDSTLQKNFVIEINLQEQKIIEVKDIKEALYVFDNKEKKLIEESNEYFNKSFKSFDSYSKFMTLLGIDLSDDNENRGNPQPKSIYPEHNPKKCFCHFIRTIDNQYICNCDCHYFEY